MLPAHISAGIRLIPHPHCYVPVVNEVYLCHVREKSGKYGRRFCFGGTCTSHVRTLYTTWPERWKRSLLETYICTIFCHKLLGHAIVVLAVEILVQHTHKWNLSHLDTLGWKKVSHSVKCSVKLYVNMVFGTAKFIEVSFFRMSWSEGLHCMEEIMSSHT